MGSEDIILCDFDGTLCENVWAQDKWAIGEPIKPVCKALRNAALKYRIIIYTARHSVQEPEITKWLNRHRIPFDHIEFNKRYAKWYVDDKALTLDGFVNMFGGDD